MTEQLNNNKSQDKEPETSLVVDWNLGLGQGYRGSCSIWLEFFFLQVLGH